MGVIDPAVKDSHDDPFPGKSVFAEGLVILDSFIYSGIGGHDLNHRKDQSHTK